jgi:hypothetical protein
MWAKMPSYIFLSLRGVSLVRGEAVEKTGTIIFFEAVVAFETARI